MNGRSKVLTAAVLSASVGLGAQSIFAQSAPSGSPSAPSTPGQTIPEPGPKTQPTIPGQPAPGLPQTGPLPGQPGTIPERVEKPRSGDNMVVSTEHIKKAQEALKAKGLNPGTDGKMDEKTQQALRDFQKVNNLPATGVLDAQTAAKLGISIDSKSGGASGSSGVSGGASGGASGSVGGTGASGGTSGSVGGAGKSGSSSSSGKAAQ
ncbi:MAG TPA: peptidoglycan-binding protein [Candidatus Binatia bacterium]|nr:peptidoglycan-binding protein [Candidatus Binatia bacterium]